MSDPVIKTLVEHATALYKAHVDLVTAVNGTSRDTRQDMSLEYAEALIRCRVVEIQMTSPASLKVLREIQAEVQRVVDGAWSKKRNETERN